MLVRFEATDPLDRVAVAGDGQIDGFRAADDRQSVGAVDGIVGLLQVEGGFWIQVNGECAAGLVGIIDVGNDLTDGGRSWVG